MIVNLDATEVVVVGVVVVVVVVEIVVWLHTKGYKPVGKGINAQNVLLTRLTMTASLELPRSS